MKTTLQKLIEKTLMLERNSQFTVCTLDEGLVIGLGSGESANVSFTPIAPLLSHEDIGELQESQEIQIGWTGVTNVLLEMARKELVGKLPEDFEADVQHPALTDEAIDHYQKEIAKAEEAFQKESA